MLNRLSHPGTPVTTILNVTTITVLPFTKMRKLRVSKKVKEFGKDYVPAKDSRACALKQAFNLLTVIAKSTLYLLTYCKYIHAFIYIHHFVEQIRHTVMTEDDFVFCFFQRFFIFERDRA